MKPLLQGNPWKALVVLAMFLPCVAKSDSEVSTNADLTMVMESHSDFIRRNIVEKMGALAEFSLLLIATEDASPFGVGLRISGEKNELVILGLEMDKPRRITLSKKESSEIRADAKSILVLAKSNDKVREDPGARVYFLFLRDPDTKVMEWESVRIFNPTSKKVQGFLKLFDPYLVNRVGP